jgi:HAD superfamily hydrolase (TIGR01509 family)
MRNVNEKIEMSVVHNGAKPISHYSLLISHYKEKYGFGQFCPKAVLFDMDGVIYNSMPNHAVSWHQAMSDYGLDMPLDGAYKFEGMRGTETIKQLVREQWHRELDDDEAAKMYAHKSALFAERVKTHPAAIMPGVKELMEQIKADGLKICVVTGSGQHTLLDRLLSDFEGLLTEQLIVTAFDVEHGKPNPEPYLKGMQKCGTQTWESIVVENAPLGVEAAVAAHCFTIAVNTGPLDDKELLDKGADLLFKPMTALSEAWSTLSGEFVSL